MTGISCLHEVPLKEWLSSGKPVKFLGDNVDFGKVVRDIRSDHRKSLVHMYSLLVLRHRVHDPSLATTGSTTDLINIEATAFLPDQEIIDDITMNLTVLAGRILCENIKCMKPLAKVVPNHIPHEYSDAMSEKSEAFFLDVLEKNEAKSADMLVIMKTMHDYLGEDFPNDNKVLSGGDQLTCERQSCAQKHVMDGDVPRDRLELVEPVTEDWHTLMCFLKVRGLLLRLHRHMNTK